jgi:hypothetical protein
MTEQFLGVGQELLAVCRIIDAAAEDETPKRSIHEELCHQGIEITSVGQIQQTSIPTRGPKSSVSVEMVSEIVDVVVVWN